MARLSHNNGQSLVPEGRVVEPNWYTVSNLYQVIVSVSLVVLAIGATFAGSWLYDSWRKRRELGRFLDMLEEAVPEVLIERLYALPSAPDPLEEPAWR